MLDFNRKRKRKEILYSKITISLLIIVFIFFANSAWSAYKKASFANNNKNKAENDLNNIKERKKNLTYKIDKLKTKRGVEEDIREKFGLVKKGEEVVMIVDSNDENSKDKENNVGIVSKWWRKILKLF